MRYWRVSFCRRDGSPFFNLLLVAPLFDSQGKLRYYIGAQVDVTQLLRDGAGMESVSEPQAPEEEGEKDVFRELTELFNDVEIETARMYAGRLHKGRCLKREGATRRGRSRSRVVLKAGTPPHETTTFPDATSPIPQTLKGVYKNYLLLRPYPSLRILFTSPSLRTPGIHQMHFLHKIGGSDRVREELHDALRSGNGVTAKVLWLTNRDGDGRGRERWVHCTPLMDATGEVGVWMVIVVDPPTGQTRREVVETYRRPSVRKEGTPEDTHLRPGDTSSTQLPPTPTSPVPRIVRHELEVETDKGPQMFRLSDYIPPRGSSKKRPQKEKCDVDAFAKSLGMLAAN
ncbi:hypothetical protein K440DRAFT_618866 [Wilcoxina mikolae CBS 423.85]|nr:hypothetical protein K440DRAFT_618866 [Wilcoxina mikolae CBS 423.85]